MSKLVWGFKESNDLFKLKVSGRIREGHKKEVAFDQESYKIMRKWIPHMKEINGTKILKEVWHIKTKQNTGTLRGQCWEIKVTKVRLGSITRHEIS